MVKEVTTPRVKSVEVIIKLRSSCSSLSAVKLGKEQISFQFERIAAKKQLDKSQPLEGDIAPCCMCGKALRISTQLA